jgi:hypothetical protein
VILVLWDASAMAKRFVAEIGSQTVNTLFLAVPPAQMVGTIMSLRLISLATKVQPSTYK